MFLHCACKVMSLVLAPLEDHIMHGKEGLKASDFGGIRRNMGLSISSKTTKCSNIFLLCSCSLLARIQRYFVSIFSNKEGVGIRRKVRVALIFGLWYWRIHPILVCMLFFSFLSVPHIYSIFMRVNSTTPFFFNFYSKIYLMPI